MGPPNTICLQSLELSCKLSRLRVDLKSQSCLGQKPKAPPAPLKCQEPKKKKNIRPKRTVKRVRLGWKKILSVVPTQQLLGLTKKQTKTGMMPTNHDRNFFITRVGIAVPGQQEKTIHERRICSCPT